MIGELERSATAAHQQIKKGRSPSAFTINAYRNGPAAEREHDQSCDQVVTGKHIQTRGESQKVWLHASSHLPCRDRFHPMAASVRQRGHSSQLMHVQSPHCRQGRQGNESHTPEHTCSQVAYSSIARPPMDTWRSGACCFSSSKALMRVA